MQKFFLIVFLLVLFSCISEKKGNTESTPTKPDEITVITEVNFNEEIHDFGKLKSGEIVLFTFVFTNTGKHNYIINEVKTDCGCIIANYPKEAVKPGKPGLIEVEFDSSGMFGKQFKSIEIHANTKELKHLAIFAEIKNEQIEIKY